MLFRSNPALGLINLFSMGSVPATIELSNPRQPQLHPMEVQALANTGSLMLCIPEHVVVQLQLEQESLREVTVADGRVMQVPYVGPILFCGGLGAG